MATPLVGGPLRSEGRKSTYTTTALKRWSCQSADELPGFLSTYECFANGGWWHDPNILAATGQGMEIEERKAWKGWWNEQIVQLVELSMQQKDALTVLLTGRAEGPFENIIKRMIKSRKLVFDLVCLKPEVGPNSQRFSSTMNFKQTFLEDLVITYKHADEIRVYEDRVKHVKGFREYFEKLNRVLQPGPPSAPRKPINAEVIQVAEETAFLPPVTEAAEVQRMINSHNKILTSTSGNTTKSPYGRLRIKRTIFFTAYLLSNTDSSRIITYVLNPLIPPNMSDSTEIKYLANAILITPRPPSKSIIDRVGGMGKTVRWRITDTGVFENKLWAAKVTPVLDSEIIYTENPEPIMVLAMRKSARPTDAGRIRNWQPVIEDNALVFDATVGQKMALMIEEEHPGDGEWETLPKSNNKRRLAHQNLREDEGAPLPAYLREGDGNNRATSPNTSSYANASMAPSSMRDREPGSRNYPPHPHPHTHSQTHPHAPHGPGDAHREYSPYHSRNNPPYPRHPGEGGGGGGSGAGGGRYYGDEGGPPPRRGGGAGANYRGSRGRGRGGRGRGRSRGGGGRDGASGSHQYRSLDDHVAGGSGSGGGYEGPGGGDERGYRGGGGPVMNY
ncbi:conserved hypothetical protein [Histoplasma capsulatum var. duboisii H88]|uniref:Swiss Army Knife RNA repair protein HAD domain-containing protein n=2 Tax=Ajellomyces capsulatus TaxID=5037 RepID=F0UFN2_AJEC8|nr:conserved hypothetical protein [Histoplasma capsulatum H143]EGC44984.1 conserved hypothetical protein [Histoplasma capsulatum var. duboisii H88]